MEEERRPKLHYVFDDEETSEQDLSSSMVGDHISKYFEAPTDEMNLGEDDTLLDQPLGAKPIYSNGTRIPDSMYGRGNARYTDPDPMQDMEALSAREKKDAMAGWFFWGGVVFVSFWILLILEGMQILGVEGVPYPFEGAIRWLARVTMTPAYFWKVLFLTIIFSSAMLMGCGKPIPYFLRVGGRENEVEDMGAVYLVHTLVGIGCLVYAIAYYEVWGGVTDILLLVPRGFFAFVIITVFTGDIRLHKLAENKTRAIALIILETVLFNIVFMFVLYQVIIPLVMIVAYSYLVNFLSLGDGSQDLD